MNNHCKVVASAALLGLLALQARADAAQVNVAGTAFHTQFMGGDSILYFGISAANFTSTPLTMIAPLPRVPGGTALTVFVDGYGVVGTYNCTISTSGMSKSFAKTSLGNWTGFVNFTAAELPSSSYLSISCSVPSDGAIRGVTISN